MPAASRATSPPMPPRPISPSVLPVSCGPSRVIQTPARTSRSMRGEIARGRPHQRDGVLGDRRVAVALDGVNLDATRLERADIHVARSARAEKHDVLERRAKRHLLGRHEGVIVESDLITRHDLGQRGAVERLVVHRDRRVVRRAVDARVDRLKLMRCSRERSLSWEIRPWRDGQIIRFAAAVNPSARVLGGALSASAYRPRPRAPHRRPARARTSPADTR